MAFKLDGYPVVVGDVMHDVVLGVGAVEASTDNHIELKFGNRRVLYREGGSSVMFHNRRTLYWFDPVVTTPPKDTSKWGLVRKLCLNVTKEVIEHKGNVDG